MPLVIKGESYYRTAEVCRMLDIGKSTILRWFRSGIVEDVSSRDWRGWRLFTNSDIKRICRLKDSMHSCDTSFIDQNEKSQINFG